MPPSAPPSEQASYFVLDRLEAATLKRGVLRILDRPLDGSLAVGVTDAAHVGDDAVMGEHRCVHGV